MKPSFILYADQRNLVDHLNQDQKAWLLDAIFSYANDSHILEAPDGESRIVFTVLRQQIDRDTQKWDKTREARSKAGKQGGIAKARNAKQDVANIANASDAKQSLANLAVTVTGTVNGTVNGTDNISSTNQTTGSLEEQFQAIKTMALSIRTEWFDEDRVLALWKKGTYRAYVGKILEVMPAFAKEKGWDKCEARFLKNFSDVLKDGAWKNYEPKKEKYDGPWI